MEVLRQCGVEYDFRQSQVNVGPAARQWITPRIVSIPCDKALNQILDPVGLTYDVVNGKVVLKQK